ncbi:MAG TPA: acetate kinase [Polyangiaceae bacterium]|nr:acetate kinase [Polyangiaceae bacterium]
MQDSVLVLNAGSSSLKFAVVRPGDGARPFEGLAERLGSNEAKLRLGAPGEEPTRISSPGLDHESALTAVLHALDERGLSGSLMTVGHRVVHGGERFAAPTLLDDDVIAAIDGLSHLAPLHNPVNLLGIHAAKRAFPRLPQVAVFDTAFHQTLPEFAYRYAVPRSWYTDHGVRRYGFHGTSHAFVASEVARRLGRPLEELQLVTAHLGNGASATAISGGRSVDTSMGLTPLAGLVMGTRSGDVDPALIGYMAGRLPGGLDATIDDLYHHSGLLGLSGHTNDLRELSARADAGDAAATLAIDVFCYRLSTTLAGLSAALPRLDALIFTGGIGEHSVRVRERSVERLAVLGCRLDPVANAAHGAPRHGRIDAGTGPSIWVIATDEERRIAEECWQLVSAGVSNGSASS